MPADFRALYRRINFSNWNQHRAKRQPHNGTDHANRQRRNCEQRLQCGNQQHQPQQQAACGKGPYPWL